LRETWGNDFYRRGRRKTRAQSEPDIIRAVAARATKWGIAANSLTQKNALAWRAEAKMD
jgi:hypothetical protein